MAFFPWLSSRFAVVSVLFIANHGLLHRERRSLFVKYVQSGMHYQDRRYNHRLPALTALQRAVLEMPAGYDDPWHNESRHAAYSVHGERSDAGGEAEARGRDSKHKRGAAVIVLHRTRARHNEGSPFLFYAFCHSSARPFFGRSKIRMTAGWVYEHG